MRVKQIVCGLFGLLAVVAIGFGQVSQAYAASIDCDAVVDANYEGRNGAQVGDAKMYSTVQSAIRHAAGRPGHPYVIYIKKGEYNEKVNVDKPNVTLIGEDRDKTIITFDACAATLDANDKPYGTVGCGSLTVKSSNFRAENLTIANDFDYVANDAKPKDDPDRIKNTQAVALKLEGTSDKAVFKHVKLTGWQDTLFADAGRAYFVDCIITGHVDFIFGSSQAVFNKCTIVSREHGYVVAPSTAANKKYGFLVINSKLVKEGPNVKDGSVYLGRPWHAWNGVNSETVYVNCSMDTHISKKGWTKMSKDLPEENRLYEYGSTGLGAKADEYRQKFVLTAEQAKEYSIKNVLEGWDPEKP